MVGSPSDRSFALFFRTLPTLFPRRMGKTFSSTSHLLSDTLIFGSMKRSYVGIGRYILALLLVLSSGRVLLAQEPSLPFRLPPGGVSEVRVFSVVDEVPVGKISFLLLLSFWFCRELVGIFDYYPQFTYRCRGY